MDVMVYANIMKKPPVPVWTEVKNATSFFQTLSVLELEENESLTTDTLS